MEWIYFLLEGMIAEVIAYILFVVCVHYQNKKNKIDYSKIAISIGVFWAIVKITSLIEEIVAMPTNLAWIYVVIVAIGTNCLRVCLLFCLYKICNQENTSAAMIWKRLNIVVKIGIPVLVIFSGASNLYVNILMVEALSRMMEPTGGISDSLSWLRYSNFNAMIPWLIIVVTAVSLLTIKFLKKDEFIDS